MDEKQVRDHIQLILKTYIDRQPQSGDLPEDADIRTFGVDSVDLLEFFAEIEMQFDIRFVEDELDISRLNTIDRIAQIITEKINQRAKG